MDILYSRHIEFKVNTRAKSRFGICRHKANGLDIIEIMEDLVDPSKLKPLKETIIHEVLHTCDKCQNHGILWKAYSEKINKAYGYNIKRASTYEEKGLENIVRNSTANEVKYIFKCDVCGQEIKRKRKSKFTEYTNTYSCGICGGKFERVL